MKKKGIIFFIVSVGMIIFYFQTRVRVTEELSGMGSGAKSGQIVVFDYQGFLYDSKAERGFGKLFDSTYRRHTPMRVQLGNDQIIPGLEKALLGMKVGAQRHVIIAPSMAYGKKGAGEGLIPSNATLVYQIEMRSIE